MYNETNEWVAGKQVAHLTLLEKFKWRDDQGESRSFWRCKCVCGNEVVRADYHVKMPVNHSCGCEDTRYFKGTRSKNWRGCGELSGQYFSTIKHSAKNRDLSFDLDIEACWDLFVTQDKRCSLTGWPIGFTTLRARREGVEQTASLDRVDSDEGYTPENVTWVHKDVNLMKNHFTLDRFFEVCYAVVARLEKLKEEDPTNPLLKACPVRPASAPHNNKAPRAAPSPGSAPS